MADQFTKPTISGYNSSPPSDDGSATSANQIFWATIKTKLTDPIKVLAEAIADEADAAFDALVSLFSDTVAKTGAYTVLTSDNGVLFLGNATSAAFTFTLPAAASAGDGFRVAIKKTDATANAITIDGNASETIDGATEIYLTQEDQVVTLVCDASNWHVAAEGASKVTDSITAGTTQTQAGATALFRQVNRVTASGTNGDGVKLPFAAPGAICLVINDDSAQTVQVWPADSDAIDGGSANAVDGNILAPGMSRMYIAADATNWYTALSSGPNIATGLFTRDLTAASGNVAYTGVGFRPRALFINAYISTSASAGWSFVAENETAYGIVTNWAGTADNFEAGTNVGFIVQASGAYQAATINSWDSDGFTLAWVKTGSPTGTATFHYIAFG